MTNKQLFNGINGADDKYIIEAMEDDAYLYPDIEKKSRFGGVFKVALPCAACAALIFGAVIGVRYFGGVAPVSPLEGNASEVSTDSSDVTSENSVISDDISQSIPEDTEKSDGIIVNGSLAPITPDPATFWEGELPVLPVKEFDNVSFELSLDRESGWAGYNLATERGAAVYAVADGEVYFVGERSMYTNRSVVIKHNDKLYTCYDGLDIDCGIPVDTGDKVKAGQVIGYAGLWFSHNEESMNGIGYMVTTYDPLTASQVYHPDETEKLNEWLSSPLRTPLDDVGENFDFGNISALICKDEPVIPAPYGANVYAVDAGVVDGTGYCEGIGVYVSIRHSNGIDSVYYHLEDEDFVKIGDKVEKGDVIGHISGSSFSGVSGLGYCIDTYGLYDSFLEDPE